jgi:hypothetical protein
VLDIPAHLIDYSRGDICMAYSKYNAHWEAATALSAMYLAGTWKHKTPSNDDVIEVFMGKSSYFQYHCTIFPMVNRYPAMEKWLLNASDAPPDVEVWGYEKQTFGNLKKILSARHATAI